MASKKITPGTETPEIPKTLVGAVRYFSNPDVCLDFMVQIRWPNGVTCPRCDSSEVTFLANARVWKCRVKHPQQKFSVKVGTIFEDSPLPLEKWLPVAWMLSNCKNGVSSMEVHRSVGVTQKTAWFMLHRIRTAMSTGSFIKFGGGGPVEADETFIGGKARNMHAKKRHEKIQGRGTTGKAIVFGLLDRESGKVSVKHIADRTRAALHAEILDKVQEGAQLFTDDWKPYRELENYVHEFVNHAEEYVRGNVHTNGMENFWSLLKRGLKGTYVAVEPYHLFRYIDEQAYRYNERKDEDGDRGRFLHVMEQTVGRRLTYKELTGKLAGDDGLLEGSPEAR